MEISNICTNVNQDSQSKLYVLHDNAFSYLRGNLKDFGPMGAGRHVFILPEL